MTLYFELPQSSPLDAGGVVGLEVGGRLADPVVGGVGGFGDEDGVAGAIGAVGVAQGDAVGVAGVGCHGLPLGAMAGEFGVGEADQVGEQGRLEAGDRIGHGTGSIVRDGDDATLVRVAGENPPFLAAFPSVIVECGPATR